MSERFKLGEVLTIIGHPDERFRLRDAVVIGGYRDKEAKVNRYKVKTEFGNMDLSERQLAKKAVP